MKYCKMKHIIIILILTLTSCGLKIKEEVIATEKKLITVPKTEFNLIDAVLKNLNIKKENCKMDLVALKENPKNTEETIMVIPEVVDEGEQYFELSSHILIVNTKTGKIINKYFESSKTNQWVSDAIELTKISIDTAPYNITHDKRAFGIRVYYHGMSRANPYNNETISLFIKSENTLKNILKNYDVTNYAGEWDTNCDGTFIGEKKILIVSDNKTNGYFDILVKNTITETKNFETANGDCDYKEKVTAVKTVLKFDREEYKENNCTFLPLNVFVDDSDNGTNIRQEPNGNIILKLKEQSDYFTLTITEANNGWFKVVKAIGIDNNNIEIPGRRGWIHSSVIGVSTRKDIELLDAPYGTKIGTIGQEISVRIKDKCSGWVKIEYEGLSGWVESKWLCGSPVTTCP